MLEKVEISDCIFVYTWFLGWTVCCQPHPFSSLPRGSVPMPRWNIYQWIRRMATVLSSTIGDTRTEDWLSCSWPIYVYCLPVWPLYLNFQVSTESASVHRCHAMVCPFGMYQLTWELQIDFSRPLENMEIVGLRTSKIKLLIALLTFSLKHRALPQSRETIT